MVHNTGQRYIKLDKATMASLKADILEIQELMIRSINLPHSTSLYICNAKLSEIQELRKDVELRTATLSRADQKEVLRWRTEIEKRIPQSIQAV